MKKLIIYLLLIMCLSISSQNFLRYKRYNINQLQTKTDALVLGLKKGFIEKFATSKNKMTANLFCAVSPRKEKPNSILGKSSLISTSITVKKKLVTYIKSNEDLSFAKRNEDVLFGILDQYTGEEIVLSKINGTPEVDKVIYFQLGTEYFKRNYEVIDSRWFGFISDLELDANNNYVSGTDNSEKLSKLLAYSGNLKISKGNYFFNSNGFKVKSNTTLDLSGSVLKYKSTSIYSSFLILGGETFLTESINLLNGKIIGNKNELATITEWMHGISIIEAKNIKIENIESNLNRGDGLYIGMNNEIEENRSRFIKIVDCVFDRNHRQGCSVVSGQNITFTDTKFINTKGTDPQSGLDIEPNPYKSGFRDLCMNIKFNNCEFSGNASTGVRINGILNNGTNSDDISDVEFTKSIFSKNIDTGIEFRACKNIKVDNCIVNAVENGIIFSDAVYRNIAITNTKIFGNKSGVGIYIIANTSDLISEDIKIDNCEVYNFGRYGVLVDEKSSTFLKSFMFTNNKVHHNYHNIHIQKGVVNAVYSGNTSAKVGLDINNIKYPGWTFGWEFSKRDDAATRKDSD